MEGFSSCRIARLSYHNLQSNTTKILTGKHFCTESFESGEIYFSLGALVAILVNFALR